MARRHAKPVYRRPLQEVWAEHGGEAPGVFAESLAVLRQRGLQMGGLFQGRTDERKVRLLERAWDLGQSPLRAARVQDCHAVADSLLLWLRLLPAPVVPCRLFRQFVRCNSSPEGLAQLHYLLDQLEPCELGVLQPLLAFLHAYRAEQRRAGGRGPDCGRVFGPALLRPHEGPLPMAFPEDTAAAAALVDCLVADYPAVFEHPHAAVGAHKPPCRAKRARKPEAWQPEPAQPAGSGGCREGAEWPGRHLRVVVVPPFTDAEVCYVEQEDGLLLQHSSSALPPGSSLQHGSGSAAPACHPAGAHRSSSRLASVPEACPLDACCQDPELDDLVGSLLCGSAQSTLFEADDGAFLARAASLLACPPPRVPAADACCEAASVSSDGTADCCGSLQQELLGADSPLASPQRPHHRRGWEPALGRWLEVSH